MNHNINSEIYKETAQVAFSPEQNIDMTICTLQSQNTVFKICHTEPRYTGRELHINLNFPVSHQIKAPSLLLSALQQATNKLQITVEVFNPHAKHALQIPSLYLLYQLDPREVVSNFFGPKTRFQTICIFHKSTHFKIYTKFGPLSVPPTCQMPTCFLHLKIIQISWVNL